MEGVKVDFAFFPADFVSVADTPAQGVKDSHDNATGEHNQPAKKEDVGDSNEYHAGHCATRAAERGAINFVPCVTGGKNGDH